MNLYDVSRDCLTPVELSQVIDPDGDVNPQTAAHLSTCADCQTRLEKLTNTARLQPYHAVARSKKFQASYFGPQASADYGTSSLRIARYKIESVIGVGGMGIVYRATDSELNRQVAIKVLTNVDHTTGLARFERESNALSQLNHANVVPIYTSGKADDGRPYLVMPLIEGPSLQEVLERESMAPREAAMVAIQIAHGLEAAHQRGLVHRDVKPANVLIDARDNQAKVLDFGLVRGSQDNTLTRTHMICGTPEYMSPEQAKNLEKADACSDVYSLGVTLYECLTGSVPFHGRPLDVLRQHRENEPVPPRRLNQAVPRDLQTICLKAMEKEPQQRYATAKLFADDLERFLDGQTILARPVGFAGKAWRWSLRNRALATASALGIAALLTGSIVSTLLWINSEKNATLAEQRNRSLLASESTLKENLTTLRQSIQNNGRDAFENRAQFSQLPTSVRNTLMISLRQSWELLFKSAANEPIALQQLVDDVVEASEIALSHGMELRAVELTELNRRVVTQLLKLESVDSTVDLLRAARVHNLFADARQSRRTLDTEPLVAVVKAALDDAKRFAELALKHASAGETNMRSSSATIESIMADRGLIDCNSDLTPDQKAAQLIALAEFAESSTKHDSVMDRWLELQQRLSLEIARASPVEQAIEYRTQRSKQLERLIQWHESRENAVGWMIGRRLAVNRVMLGAAYGRIGKQQQARELWIKSIESLESYLSVHPMNAQIRADYFETLLLVANLDWESHERESALELYDQALSQIHVLVQMNPQDHELARRSAQVHGLVGQRYLDTGDKQAAGEAFSRGGRLAIAAERNANKLSAQMTATDQRLAVRLFQQAADAYDAANRPELAASAREQMDQSPPSE